MIDDLLNHLNVLKNLIGFEFSFVVVFAMLEAQMSFEVRSLVVTVTASVLKYHRQSNARMTQWAIDGPRKIAFLLQFDVSVLNVSELIRRQDALHALEDKSFRYSIYQRTFNELT